MRACQRDRATFMPIPQRECGHVADLEIRNNRLERQVALCGCCFVELTKATGGHWVKVVIDLRTGLILPADAAMTRAERLN